MINSLPYASTLYLIVEYYLGVLELHYSMLSGQILFIQNNFHVM